MKYPSVGTSVTVVFTVAAKGLSSDRYVVMIVGCGMVAMECIASTQPCASPQQS